MIYVVYFRYETEINHRNDAENEFVMLKKVQYQYAVMMAMIDTVMCISIEKQQLKPG